MPLRVLRPSPPGFSLPSRLLPPHFLSHQLPTRAFASTTTRLDKSPTQITTSFILSPTSVATPKVLLLLRHPQNPLYASRWTAISGKVETWDVSPASAALREIHEETGLQAGILELLAGGSDDGTGRVGAMGQLASMGSTNLSSAESSGGAAVSGAERSESGESRGTENTGTTPFELMDEKLGKKWIVWPFLWRVKEDAEVPDIRLEEGENVEARWATLEEMKGLETVDGLVGTLERVLRSARK